MDFLQIAIIFLIILLSVFLTITGIQVFFILKDLKSSLDKINKILQSGEEITRDIERPVEVVSNLVTGFFKKEPKPSGSRPKRFYKKML